MPEDNLCNHCKHRAYMRHKHETDTGEIEETSHAWCKKKVPSNPDWGMTIECSEFERVKGRPQDTLA